HYAQSRVTVVDVSDPNVLALLDELGSANGYASAYEAEKWHYHGLAESEGERADRAEKHVAELESIATDYGVKFQKAQDALKHQALLHKSQMEVAEKQVEELTMWVKRLAHSLRNAKPNSKLHYAAMDYLSRKGLISVEDVLR
ncbi:ead/Ea22-like family protein, partial [Salmonella enterica]|nr:ead/Ea22-like family protein [Salmonella enterica]